MSGRMYANAADSLIPVCICAHDDYWFLAQTIGSFGSCGPVIVFVSRIAWDGSEGKWQRTAAVAAKSGAEVLLGEWRSEEDHRNYALSLMRARGHTFILMPDSDEVIEMSLLEALRHLAKQDACDLATVNLETYWKTPSWVVRPHERFQPPLLLNVNRNQYLGMRDFEVERRTHLGRQYGVLHHLSYVGSDLRIGRKINTTSHRNEVMQDWFLHVWTAWDQNKGMHNLHPTHPSAYDHVENVMAPEILRRIVPLQACEAVPDQEVLQNANPK